MKAFARDLAKEALHRFLPDSAFVWRLPARAAGGIALTFDDGPDPERTPALLDLLDSHEVKASFFLIGAKVEAHPAIARRIAERGHTLGGHTYSHRELPTLSAEEIRGELERCREAVAQAAGVDTRLVRPPRGRVDWRSLRAVTRQGYTLVHWSRTYSDYRQDGVEALLARIRAAPPKDRDVILLHDVLRDTAEALRHELPAIERRGLRFYALDEPGAKS